MKVFIGIFPSKNIVLLPWTPYLKTDTTSFLILLLNKDFKEKETPFLTEIFLHKDFTKWAKVLQDTLYSVSVIGSGRQENVNYQVRNQKS